MQEAIAHHPGYWKDANDNADPGQQDQGHRQGPHACGQRAVRAGAQAERALIGFKTSAMHAVTEFVERSLAHTT
jgi:hypothetical protein